MGFAWQNIEGQGIEKRWIVADSIDTLIRMKEWKPEREFKKADFPANPAGATNPAKTQGAAPSSRSADQGRQARRFSADLSSVATDQRSNQEAEITTDLKPGRVLKTWMPPSVGEPSAVAKGPSVFSGRPISAPLASAVKSSSPAPGSSAPAPTPASAQRTTPKVFAPESKEQAARRAAEEASTKRATADMSGALLDELVIARPVEATDLLRRWFWEKPSGGTTPQTKTYVILHSMKKETLVELYGCFTAMERRQMHEIYSKKRTVVKSEILSCRSEFMQRLSQSFE